MGFPESLFLAAGPFGIPPYIVGRIIHDGIKDRRARREAYAKWQELPQLENLHGNAELASSLDLLKGGAFDGHGIPIGYESGFLGRQIYHNDDTSIISFGRSGEGKGSQAIIPAALQCKDYSIIAPDVNGELFNVTAEQRLKYGPVYVLDPYQMFPDVLRKIPRGSYNPLGLHWVHPGHPEFWPRLSRLSTGLIPKSEGRSNYWDLSSRMVATDFNGVLRKYARDESVTLTRLAELIAGDPAHFARWIIRSGMLRDDPRQVARMMRWATKKQIHSQEDVIETAKTNLNGWLDDSLANVSQASTFHYSQCAEQVMTVYLLVPHGLIGNGEAASRWLTTNMTCAASELIRFNPNRRVRTILLCDEFFELPVENVDHMLISARKCSVILWIALQDIHELKQLYPQTWPTFLSSAGVVQWLSATDLESSRLVSEMLGNREIIQTMKSQSFGANARVSQTPEWGELARFNASINRTQASRALMLPQEVRALRSDQQILWLRSVAKPILANRESYRNVRRLRSMAGANPYYPRGGKAVSQLTSNDWMNILS